ncbi:MAG: hypothetical protein NTW86_07630 [Candidatus Sumerlaeota bacterium]|nr:hypothetical protein [Candidatus Sumerlaeota bacterium]
MEIQKDFSELLTLFRSHAVEHVIVGAHALAHHGVPRYTGDVDIFVRPTPENAQRILDALDEFGFGSVGLREEDFCRPDHIVQLGYPPVRVDFMTSISGVSWEEAASGAADGVYGDVAVRYLGRVHLVLNKKATGRTKDLADVEALGEA